MSDNENDLFNFESDHLALRGNRDYSETLKTMFVLEAQRQQAIKDYNRVIKLKNECLEDPLLCVQKLREGDLGVPNMQILAEIPKINWSKFNIKVPQQYLKQITNDFMNKDVRMEEKDNKIRSSSWTTEEQRKLDELLIKYPPEEMESKRIRKIANELGTRTQKQVSSRLQKYYLKLVKAGLPVPGRLPKSRSHDKKSSFKSKRFGKHAYMKPSTFFPDLDIPVVMNECEDAPGPSQASKLPDPNTSNYLLSNNYHEDKSEPVKSDVDIQLDLLKKIRLEKMYEESDGYQKFQHYGYKCDYCEEDPIEGSRWHCTNCSSDSVDYCTDCMMSQLYSETPHSLSHKFIIVRSDKEIVNSSSSDVDSQSGESSAKNDECSNFSTSESSESEDESPPPPPPPQVAETVVSPPKQHQFTESSDFSLKISESCPVNIFETGDDTSMNNGNGIKLTDSQRVSYNYLHSSLLLDS